MKMPAPFDFPKVRGHFEHDPRGGGWGVRVAARVRLMW
jgi:hypothetical protein